MVDEKVVVKVQECLDGGMNYSRTAKVAGCSDKTVNSLIRRNYVEDYTAFDEYEYKYNEPVDNLMWLDNEDKLENIMSAAFENGRGCIDYKDAEIKRYIKDEYGSLYDYLYKKNLTPLTDFVFFKCSRCLEEKRVRDFPSHRGSLLGIDALCKSCSTSKSALWVKGNPLKARISRYKRRNKAVELLFDITEEDRKNFELKFEDRCCLTSFNGVVHIDHFVPISWGHCGTYLGNMIILSKHLNISKNASNPYTWFEENYKRFNLPISKWVQVTDYLAELNGLSPQEFRSFVYWCEANKRSVDEIKADKRPSIEIWEEVR